MSKEKPGAFTFAKFSGSGNDFIVIDHRETWCADPGALAREVCRRGQSIGADGILLLESAAPPESFTMRIINSDGSEAEMCGNGARCIARFAHLQGIAPAKMTFATMAGPVSAEIFTNGDVKISLGYRVEMELNKVLHLDGSALRADFLQTGVPHTIVEVEDIERTDVTRLGAAIRHYEEFQPQGTNVNFVRRVNNNTVRIRTYERGVEAETLACGTGSVASAIAMAIRHEIVPPVHMLTQSGETLTVFFRLEDNGVADLFLQGSARLVYTGSAAEYI